MAAFLSKIRGDFQPHLKTVMGAWVAGMCDSQTSAATAAMAAFTDTFSADKQQQVLQFTFKDIIHVCKKTVTFGTLFLLLRHIFIWLNLYSIPLLSSPPLLQTINVCSTNMHCT